MVDRFVVPAAFFLALAMSAIFIWSARIDGAPVVLARADDAPAVSTRLAFPLPGFEHALRDNFDEKRGLRAHHALDIMAPRGTPVLAVDDGTVAKLYRGPMAGIAVYQFDPGKTRVYMYAHLDRLAPGLGEDNAIRRGQVIGFVGTTGNAPARAPHLHFAMHELGEGKRWWQGKAVNPYALLRGTGGATQVQAFNGP